ncbi:hypothetical protein CFR75_05085 [Komagataeibacter xylinus]|uniref:Uncharacterized protein n=2 Tax=Komagataeibacter xylinus TaxID=28448 RepID=A0A318PJK3_KOMXY|nr:hypothetical protein CXP35_14185 [Komagataeibacter xylinus]PYD57631.1 hypothetical protein CFR75_05085 [Komagataeibacter xylinus]GBQ74381.1 hypothetical protein AA15237_1849 [Komagataeibacter xylinus NBRC 15237]
MHSGTEGFHFMHISRRLLALAIAIAPLASLPCAAMAAESSLGTPSGTVTMKFKSLDIGVGHTWGTGKLVYGHHTYRFKVEGGSLAAVGYANIKGSGTVYNLHSVKDFEGSYAAVNGDVTAGTGIGAVLLNNPAGVRIRLDTTSSGGRLAAAAQGMKITFTGK